MQPEYSERKFIRAYELGVSYFDTAYIQSSSEVIIRAIFGHNKTRDKIFIGDKLPHCMIMRRAGLKKNLLEQL
ncbi:MAG: hypothetical protein HUJ51_00895 [Eggerthellaceae bacterium]|nr:hypothetical protein [Eggerthellaceae bacterium]